MVVVSRARRLATYLSGRSKVSLHFMYGLGNVVRARNHF